MSLSDLIVCSFYTADDYYRQHADRLRKSLAEIGVEGVLEEVVKQPDEDWADICRRKISFLGRVCEQNPDKKVFWVDVDCQLLSLPDQVAGFTADLIGFQRGFGTPTTIGYANRTRFWEPCFFGINTTPAARKFVSDAVLLESDAKIKATDDYFFEESWRANGHLLNFHVLSSTSVLGRNTGETEAFFAFGSSGNVAEFKDKVVQHEPIGGARGAGNGRRRALRFAKRVEGRLGARSTRLAARARRLSDRAGLTHVLTRGAHDTPGVSRHRQALINHMVAAGQRGELQQVREVGARLNSGSIPTRAEAAAQQAAESFAHYALDGTADSAIALTWWARPFPGNFGDWLSPAIVHSASSRPVRYVPPTSPGKEPHLVSVGSIGRFIRNSSIVVGTGISTEDVELSTKAHFHSVRGPVTARVLRSQGGPDVQSLGDPGALLRRLHPVERGATNGRIAVVRHFTHANLPITLTEDHDELSVLMSHPEEIRAFVGKLNEYDAVVTSAMHVLIACHSYGIPVAMVGFRGFEDAVHGSGIKYDDYARGVGLDASWSPTPIGMDLRQTNLDDLLRTERIADAKLDEIELAVSQAISDYLEQTA